MIQSSPIHIESAKRTIYKVSPFADYGKYSEKDILEFYSSRKERLDFKQSSLTLQPLGSGQSFEIDIIIRIPPT